MNNNGGVLVFFALLLCVRLTSSQCYSIKYTPSSSSLCSGGETSTCAHFGVLEANEIAANLTAAMNAIDSSGAMKIGNSACAVVGGSATSWWVSTNAALAICPKIPQCTPVCTDLIIPPTTAVLATTKTPCCSYLVKEVQKRCGGSSVASLFTPGTLLTPYKSLLQYIAPEATMCTESSTCYGNKPTCFSALIAPSTLSMCRGGTASYCANSPLEANQMALKESLDISLIELPLQDQMGAPFCQLFGGGKTSWWTTKADVCPTVSTCTLSTCEASSSSSIDVTAFTPAYLAYDTQKSWCCSYLRSQIANKMCSFTDSSLVNDIIKAGVVFNSSVARPLGTNSCSEDSNCVNPSSSASRLKSFESLFTTVVAIVIATTTIFFME